MRADESGATGHQHRSPVVADGPRLGRPIAVHELLERGAARAVQIHAPDELVHAWNGPHSNTESLGIPDQRTQNLRGR